METSETFHTGFCNFHNELRKYFQVQDTFSDGVKIFYWTHQYMNGVESVSYQN